MIAQAIDLDAEAIASVRERCDDLREKLHAANGQAQRCLAHNDAITLDIGRRIRMLTVELRLCEEWLKGAK